MSSDDKKRHILKTALDAFFRFGYRRVNMKEIAELARISRPGLYLHFKTKEDVFEAAILQYADDLLIEIEAEIKTKKTIEDKVMSAFEIWSVRSFDRTLQSPEATEMGNALFDFAQKSFGETRKKFEAILASAIRDAKTSKAKKTASPDRIAQLLVGSMRGYKLSAKDGAELRKMLHELVKLVF